MALERTGRSIAIVHDYLTQRGGAERVVLSLSRAFPEAPLYTSLYEPTTTYPEFQEREVRPLWLDRVRQLRNRHRLALPILPMVFSSSRVDTDVVVASSSGWAHAIRTRGRKLVYCHSPAKWLYRRDDYLGANPSRLVRASLHLLDPVLRRFDRSAARSADTYLANSTFIANQIREVYGIESRVVFPPPGVTPDGPCVAVDDVEPGFVLTVSRLLPYKNVAPVVEAFRRLPDLSLVVVGDGPQFQHLLRGAPANVRFMREVEDGVLRWLYSNCRGLVAASREDFGLTPVEAACFGKPVAALRWGGYLDSVVPGLNGVFFDTPDPVKISAGVEEIAHASWSEVTIRAHAEVFSEARFISELRGVAGA
jgi:glycosyltransferase involved in cell wall biosynthesis